MYVIMGTKMLLLDVAKLLFNYNSTITVRNKVAMWESPAVKLNISW